jgi:carbonic anhydrase/acetyltransferase-like protein (isoleucine patch superfamily)
MSLNEPAQAAAPQIAGSARIIGQVALGVGTLLSQGLVVRAHGAGTVEIGHHSAVLENGTVTGWPAQPVRIGQRSVFGHRCQIIGATVGDLCEIGNGAILMPGARLGDGVIAAEGTLVPPGTIVPPDTVIVGRPATVLRTATDADRARIAALRDHELDLIDHPLSHLHHRIEAGADMGTLYSYRDKRPAVADSAVLFDSAEVTGDVSIGEQSIIGAGVKIIGDSHGPVRIGARVQILENTVLHLLPDNELIVGDDVTIGPGAMIHGCHIGAGTVVEPGAIVCDGALVGAGSVVRAGSCVVQRRHIPPLSIAEGFPAKVIGTLDAPPPRPAWALPHDALHTIAVIRREPHPQNPQDAIS